MPQKRGDRGVAAGPGAAERAALEAAKRASTAQLLFRCARRLNERALARVPAEPGQVRVRAAHTSLFPHIDLEGTRLTELARRVGITKQAVAQLVDELEGMGVLERIPDPHDGRAKRIRFTREGGLVLFRGLELLREIEAELRDALGERTMDQLHRALIALDGVLQDDPPP